MDDSSRQARISDLLDELDALAAQLDDNAGGDTISKLALDVSRARAELAVLDEEATTITFARLFDVAHQRLASVLQDHRMPSADRRALEASVADLQAWHKELLEPSTERAERT